MIPSTFRLSKSLKKNEIRMNEHFRISIEDKNNKFRKKNVTQKNINYNNLTQF